MNELDTRNVVPLYEQIESDIREKILTKIYASGEQIPTEMELCKMYGVSRITVRRALDDLIVEGLLERRHGKGTFVALHRSKVVWVSLDGNSFTHGFSDICNRKVPERKIVAKREYEPTSHEREMLQLDADDKVLILERLIVDENQKILEKAGYSSKRYPGFLTEIGDNMSTYKLLSEKYGMTQKHMTREISLAYATEEQGKLLGCLAGAPLFQVVKVLYGNDEIPVHFSILLYCADTTVIQIDR